MAEATGTPGSGPPRSPTSYSVVAPYSPATAARAAFPPQVIAETVAPKVRPCVRSSSDVVVNEPFDGSVTIQMFDRAITLLENLDRLEKTDDAFGAVALVHVLLAGGARLGGDDVGDFLARAVRSGLIREREVRHAENFERLGLGGHYALEGGVARLDHAGGDGHQRRQGRGHLVVAGFGLTLDLDGRPVDRHRLGEGNGRQPEQF